jgi:hypothetical protein
MKYMTHFFFCGVRLRHRRLLEAHLPLLAQSVLLQACEGARRLMGLYKVCVCVCVCVCVLYIYIYIYANIYIYMLIYIYIC